MWLFLIYIIFYIANNEKTTTETQKGVVRMNIQIDMMQETINDMQETISQLTENNFYVNELSTNQSYVHKLSTN